MTNAKQNKPRSARNLASILATRIAVLINVALSIFAIFAVYNTYTTYQQSLTAQQQLIAQEAGKTVSSFIQDKFAGLETAVGLVDPFSANAESQKNILASLLGQYPAFRQFVIIDSRGQQLAQVSRASQTLSSQFVAQLKGDALIQTSKGQRFISPVYIDDVTNEPLIAIAVPAKNVFGDFQGTLVAEVNLKFMWDLVNQLKVGETGYAYVVDNQGNLIAFGDTGRVLRGENLQQISEVKEFTQNPSASTDTTPEVANYTGLLGGAVVGTYVPLGTPQWAVVVELPASEANQPVLQSLLVNGIAVLVATILGGLAGFLLARIIVAPLVALSHSAEEIANGNLSVEASVSGPAEIGQVASAFNLMTSRLRDLVSSLESRVAERTQSLELAAEVGRSVSQVRALDVMLKNAAELIRSRFDLYYVQVYLTDPSQANLILQSGTGTVGAELVGRSHRLPLNTASINGRAAVEKRSIVVADTAASATFRPNPLLPDTRSEMAVPLLIGEKVVGVLDLQSHKAGALNQDILSAFEALAGQLAIAVQNATFLAETQQARAEVEAQARRLTRANWVDYLDAIHKPEQIGFMFQGDQVTSLTETEQPELVSGEDTLAAPISVSGEKLGALVVEMEEQKRSSQMEQLIFAVARQVSQQIENLRLLESAERYRFDAEQASRRITREGWKNYSDANAGASLSYLYDLKEVRPFNQAGDRQIEESAISLPLKVRDETIGKLVVQGLGADDSEALELAELVSERLSAHIENLRLSEQTQERAQRERALRQITSAVRGSTDPATILRAAVRELGTLLGRKTVIRLATTDQASQSNRPTDLVGESAATSGNEPVPPAEAPIADGGDE